MADETAEVYKFFECVQHDPELYAKVAALPLRDFAGLIRIAHEEGFDFDHMALMPVLMNSTQLSHYPLIDNLARGNRPTITPQTPRPSTAQAIAFIQYVNRTPELHEEVGALAKNDYQGLATIAHREGFMIDRAGILGACASQEITTLCWALQAVLGPLYQFKM